MEDLKISKKEFLTIDCSKGTYLILGEGRYVLLNGERVKLESVLPAEVTGILNLLSPCLREPLPGTAPIKEAREVKEAKIEKLHPQPQKAPKSADFPLKHAISKPEKADYRAPESPASPKKAI
ncbi:MAG: hypothetical protein PHW04_18635 [Candidatus Wallbacteria bacterium]|nr:hypothetical protein [Candidatus Wallbacteria bacterium]